MAATQAAAATPEAQKFAELFARLTVKDAGELPRAAASHPAPRAAAAAFRSPHAPGSPARRRTDARPRPPAPAPPRRHRWWRG
jgi:ribosomal protein L12E/L44/L45/RPP1/RPP2